MTIADKTGRIYRQVSWRSEASFEECVVGLADKIFGTTSIFLPIKHRVKRGNIVTIPDGYLLDFADASSPRMFVVEVEIQTHDLFKHITDQLIRFAAAFAQDQMSVRRFIAEAIKKDRGATRRLDAALGRSPFGNVDAFLDSAIYQEFRGLVIIDERRDELDAVLKQFASDIAALEVQAFRSSDGKMLFQYESLYEEEQEPFADSSGREQSAALRQRRAKCDTIVVPARKEGFDRVFLGENAWRAIRISPGMRDRIKFIAGYQVAPVSAVTHIAEVDKIRPVGSDGKFEVIFKGKAEKLARQVKVRDGKKAPYGPVYVQRRNLAKARFLEDAMKAREAGR